MRITKESMLRLARDTALLRANQDRSITCIYLTGSLITDDPFLGGSTDIDLFVIHSDRPAQSREILYLNDDVSLDIAHIEQSRFEQPRHLRADAWLGPFLCAKPRVLYDTQHWFEFTEASVAAQFYRPEHVLERARPMEASARQTWMDFHLAQPEVSPGNVLRYLRTIENAGNAIALMTGTPLSERRFLLALPDRLNKINRGALKKRFDKLILPSPISDLDWTQWITQWEAAIQQMESSGKCPLELSKPRWNYYVKAVTALSVEAPCAAVWILMNTWSQAVSLLPSASPFIKTWQTACASFLNIKDSFIPVWDDLDSLLDGVEESLDGFAAENGLAE